MSIFPFLPRLRALLLLLVVVLVGTGGRSHPVVAQPQEPDPRPNLIVIMADDLGWNDIGYHGSEIKTPNLDRLAREGVRLHQHYAYSTCSPTRAALLTGQNPARFKIHGPLGTSADVTPEDMHLTSGLQEAGYSTHISGKWHLGEEPADRPLRYGFDTSYGYLRGQIDPYTHRYKFGDHVTWHRNDHFVEEEGHVTDLITDEAIRVIETAGSLREEPFFLYVAHHSPHFPLNEPPSWIEPYEDVFDSAFRRHFAAAVTHLDHSVGRLVEALERTGLRENTMIVFLSDNGGQQSWNAPDTQYNGRYAAHTRLGDNTPLRGWKKDLYEGGIRVPAFINWPEQLEAGHRVDVPTHVLDLSATLLEQAGAEPPADLDGTSIWPLLTGPSAPSQWHDRRFYWRQSDLQAVREGDWKLIAPSPDLEGLELYNLAEDPHETNDLADQRSDKREALRQQLEAWPW